MRPGVLLALFVWLGGVATLPARDAIAQTDAAPPTATISEQQRADIAVFRAQFMASERAYSDAARAEAERRLSALDARAGAVSQVQFALEIARIVALADNGHSSVLPITISRQANRVFLRLAPFGEDFFVMRATAENADLLGARLVAIDGRPARQLRDIGRTLFGGVPSWRDGRVAYFLESPEQMHALDAIRTSERTSYRFALPNGRLVTRTLIPEPANPQRVRGDPSRLYYPESDRANGDGWLALREANQLPWAWQEPTARFRMRDAPEADAFLIELRQVRSSDTTDISEFLLDALDAVRASNRRNVILDMRMNGGGDLDNTRAWVKRLPRIVSGNVYVLTSRFTFSAAISTIGYLKQEAPDRVIIVGEHVGDRLDFWAEGSSVRLPNANIVITYSTGRHDYHTGCRNITCHPPVARYPIAVESLAPDIEAPWTIESYMGGDDPALDAIARSQR